MDHYATLGIAKNASQDEIKKAYRKLAALHHPDRGGDTKKFQEISAAYDVLSDPNKRAQYDNPAPQGMHFSGHNMPPGFEDIFSAFGGNPFEHIFGRRPHQHHPRNRTLNLQMQINLEDAFNGKDITISVNLPSGREQLLEVKIPKGIADGTTLRLSGMGDDSVPNVPKGDIHLTVRVLPHPVFQRQGDDLVRTLDVNAIDAILGKSYQIETINGKTLELKVNPGTQNGQVLAAHGYGMPNMNDNRFVGRMLIQVNIKIPTDLTTDQLNKLKEIYN